MVMTIAVGLVLVMALAIGVLVCLLVAEARRNDRRGHLLREVSACGGRVSGRLQMAIREELVEDRQ